MFVLAYEVDYEGQSVLGVYSSLDQAMVAVQRYTEDDRRSIFYRDLVIRQFHVDAAAELDAGLVVWSYPEE